MERMTSINVVADAAKGEPLDLGAQTSPDGAVTLVLSDIEGSTELIEEVGERRWAEMLRDHNAIVRGLAQAHDGTVVKSHGDGFMLAFPSAHSALHCAIEVEQAFAAGPPDTASKIRIGAHSGFVLAEAEEFYGRNVVLAARIADRAGGGEILVSAAAKQYTESDPSLRFEHRGDFRLKGLVGEHTVYALLWDAE
ncbi:MAG: eukaryotic-like serine/threonine-protein kinase [Thermoleophilaceae bacterium]|jgi:class 3 adenylate cyclase|nr:eukaryotic-like serine/threonine-protein kinase [Thermoleophilaceae bacterium]